MPLRRAFSVAVILVGFALAGFALVGFALVGFALAGDTFVGNTFVGNTFVRAEEPVEKPLEFNRDIRPILSDTCFKCHGPDSDNRKADLRLDERDAAIASGVLIPGDAEGSSIIERVFSDDPEMVMPPPSSHKTLTAGQKELLRRWISAGAEYQPHWAFISVPRSTPVPTPTDSTGWIRNPIDAFVLTRLQAAGWRPTVEATREKWIRRVTFDLTGLPPTLEEIDAFLKDDTPTAYENVVDRLLASESYGERMAGDWLDLARYADTFGYQADREMHMWPWRDWVIRTFNSNLPYRDFVVWQTAGDLLDHPTRDQYLATAFNRLHRQTNEGGSIEEEFRIEYVSDRVHTNGTAFLGLTIECSRCHSHKYDPISQRNYYELSAFFNSIDEHGLYSHFTETAPTPALLLYEGDQEARHAELLSGLTAAEANRAAVAEREQARFSTTSASETAAVLAAIASPVPDVVRDFETDSPSGDYTFVEGKDGKAIQFGGDDAFTVPQAGAYTRASQFTIGMWLNPGELKPRSILLHRSAAAEDAAFRGYSIELDSGHPQLSLIHFWPGNAIRVRSKTAIPVDAWTHVAVSYDGHSRAAGCTIYINGRAVKVDVIRDRLTRDFVYRPEWGDGSKPELALGARMRDVGFKSGRLDSLQMFDRLLTPLEVAAVAENAWTDDGSPEFQSALLTHRLMRESTEYQTADQEWLALNVAENDLVSQVRQIMVMRELPQRRQAYILTRGAYDAPAEPVDPNVPDGILPFDTTAPRNRLGLAQWLVDDRNPLTSRVHVNRLWAIAFGKGLVSTPEDFGSQGLPPSHPELLDWLSRRFMDSGWDTKALLKLIVLSATYRQSTVPAEPHYYTEDPDNRLLARGPRHRLPAEQIRDNALAVSGLLTRRVGGPSVKPYQPAGLWEESGTGASYAQSTGENLYRRSLYTYWKRTSPPPSMTTFDATSREVCTPKRERTATPLQALVLLNDPQFVEASRVLAEKTLKQPGSLDERITTVFRLCTSRFPSEKEVAVLNRLYDGQLAYYANRVDAAKAYISVGESPRDESLNPAEHAAMSVVVNALLNFDECVTKR